MTSTKKSVSVEEVVQRFNTPRAARKYANSLVGTATDSREGRCIRKGLALLKPGAHVLDLPCGAGRLLPVLREMEFKVTGADSSPHMITEALAFSQHHQLDMTQNDFVVADICRMQFNSNEFDAVVCNRLFHHFPESSTRRCALKELNRISRGVILVSFFCNYSWDAVVFHTFNALRKEKPTDRIPISYRVFAEDIRSAGLSIVKTIPARPGISKQWYVLLQAS